MTSLRPVYRHAVMIAVSRASVPLLVKKHFLSSPGAIAANLLAALT